MYSSSILRPPSHPIIDVHAHIYPTSFPNTPLSTILKRGRDLANVKQIVCVSETLEDAKEILALKNNKFNFVSSTFDLEDDLPKILLINKSEDNFTQEQKIVSTEPWEDLHEMIAPCAGLHPVQPGRNENDRSVVEVAEVDEILEFIKEHSQDLVGIGEVGLDFTPHVLSNGISFSITNSKSSKILTADDLKQIQRQIFSKQIALSLELDLPVNVHSRSAGHYALDVLREFGARKVVMHAFDGQVKYAKHGVEMGYYFSVPPSIVRSKQKQTLVASLPLSNLLLETDSPALGPENGIDNEPSNILISAHEIARIKGLEIDEVIRQTTQNAYKLFSKLKP
ncbi:hypothetical protein G9A89_019590 [Geosiphon pyriformis]|nr:hypothetical protein G9A89_019590 [Geosiphon pyriformis]